MSSDLNDIRTYMIRNKPFMTEWINILLVWTDGRNATLIETANWVDLRGDIQTNLKVVFDFVELLNSKNNQVQTNYDTNILYLKYDDFSLENFPRYFITNKPLKKSPDNDRDIGKILEMYCYDFDYSNFYIDRLGFNINAFVGNKKEKFEIFAELCDKRINPQDIFTHYRNRIERMNESMNKINFNISFDFEYKIMYGLDTLYDKILDNDLEFIHEKYSEYYNLIDNFGSSTLAKIFTRHFENRINIDNEYDLFQWIIWLCFPFDDHTKEGIITEIPEYIKGENNHIKLIEYVKKFKFPSKQKEAYDIVDEYLFSSSS